jgi:ribosomal protein S18 acetylase RimI-like enzyme
VLSPAELRRTHVVKSAVRWNRRRLAIALQRELPKWQMRDDHWFLSILATDPRFQGRGVASALMDPVLADADNNGTPVFLRTQREANLAFYRRFGFDVTDTIALERSPTVWTMTRQPR